MNPKWIGSSTGSRMAGMPRRSAASAARSSDGMSPCSAGMSTGTVPLSAARSTVFSVRLSRKCAPALAPRASSSMAGVLELAHGIFELRKRRVRQAAEIDHVGAGPAHGGGARQDGVDAQRRGVDDLGEDADVVARQIEAARLAEIGRQILQLLRPA